MLEGPIDTKKKIIRCSAYGSIESPRTDLLTTDDCESKRKSLQPGLPVALEPGVAIDSAVPLRKYLGQCSWEFPAFLNGCAVVASDQ